MHAMNQYRGFGGPPQPQRQGGRRGNNRGGFRNSRFEHNQNQRGHNFHGGQRPHIEPVKQGPQNEPPPPQPQPQPQAQQEKKESSPQQTPQTPQQPPPKPQPPQQKPLQQQPAQKPPQNPTQPQQTPSQPPVKPESQDHVDKAAPEQRPQNQNQNQGAYQKGPIARLMDIKQEQGPNNVNGGNFGANKQGGWSQGGPGNKPGGNFGPKGFGPKQQQGQGPARNQQRNNMGRGPQDGGKPQQREEQMLANKLKDLMGPLNDIPPIEQPEVKFNGRSRLYIGNLTNDVTDEEILTMFGQFGETAELFLNKEKNFGFIKMDYRVNAEKAKREIDGRMRNGRNIRVRFAPHNSAVRVKNLPPFVSNELLYKAFEIFGKIERAYVKVDDRGKTLGEGIVEFARKPSALGAIRNCTERCFFLTSSLRPVIVESLEEPDEFDGYPEKNLPKKHPEFLRAREMGPRFSEPGSFEHEYGTRWKQLHELHRQKEEALKKELAAEEEKLEAQMEYAKYEHETELLREQLRQREQDRERQKRSWEMAERAADERREAERAQLLRQEEELSNRMRLQDDELRRRQQENTLFVQAQRLNSMLDRQEQGMFDHQQPMDGGFREQFDMPRGGYDEMAQNRGWDGPRQMDDFPNKRRRF
ncbi:splicing factor proline- and glutamine-rich [Danaus plexippus plexippus]|uniref:Splicing factor proline- and glutamine-rich n=1 Tax=Danaus plexippus plexippus TaxID=278856 RepID=A0A212F3I7_DANPL|nr:splicing factor proline- and glutamine-rich [Danaus plexippus plexippus]